MPRKDHQVIFKGIQLFTDRFLDLALQGSADAAALGAAAVRLHDTFTRCDYHYAMRTPEAIAHFRYVR